MSRWVRTTLPALAVRTALVVVCVLVGAGCQLRTEVNLTVEADGSGQVEVAVGLDDDTAGEQPELLEDLVFADLVATGWDVTGPVDEAGEFTWVRVVHDFGAPSDVAPLLDQISAEDGPFRDFRLERDDAFASTEYRFGGVVDFTDGAAALIDDPDLAEALGAEPAALIEDRLGQAIDDVVQVQVAVRLPGDVDSNAPTRATNGAVWRPSVLEREAVELSATSTITRTERLVWAGVAAAAGFALVAFTAIRLVSWRRGRHGAEGS